MAREPERRATRASRTWRATCTRSSSGPDDRGDPRERRADATRRMSESRRALRRRRHARCEIAAFTRRGRPAAALRRRPRAAASGTRCSTCTGSRATAGGSCRRPRRWRERGCTTYLLDRRGSGLNREPTPGDAASADGAARGRAPLPRARRARRAGPRRPVVGRQAGAGGGARSAARACARSSS